MSMMTVSAPRSTPVLDRVEGDAGRVSGLCSTHHLDADPLGPRRELVDGGGAEGVRRAEHHGAVLRDQDPGDLADGGGLAGAVDHDQQHAGQAVAGDGEAAVHGRVDERDQLLAQHRADVGTLALDAQASAQVGHDLLGRCDPEVGREQSVLDGLPRVLVEPLAREQAQQPATEGALRSGESLAQADQP